MPITRRHFLLGTASGLIFPAFYEKAFGYCENHNEPLLIAPKQPEEILYACKNFAAEGYQLNLGNSEEQLLKMTIRDFCITYGEGDPERWWGEEWIDVEDDEPIDMDAKMDLCPVIDWWALRHSANAKAHHYLECLDLGSQLKNARAVGNLDFTFGASPGNDYIGVEARDDVTLSLLQHRLNELGAGIKVELD